MKNFALSIILVFLASAGFSQHAIRIEKKGQGEAILFLPGFTTPGSVWDETIKHLKGSYESHCVSYAGFNGIEPIEMPWYPSIKSDLIAYIEKEDLSQLRIIGHSMGGNLAVDIAAALPDRVKSLVLVDAIPCMRELMMPGVPASQIQYNNPYNDQLLNQTEEARLQNAAMMSQNMTTKADKVELLIKWSMEADQKTFVYGYTDLLKLDLREALLEIRAKTLILGASFPDKNVVLANFEKQYENLASKTIKIAENSRHFVMFDQPEWFYGQVNTFLAD